MFGANSSNDLAGQSNAYIAALFQSDFVVKGVKLDAQVLATALAVYATNATLDGTAVAASYGFVVSGDGGAEAGAGRGAEPGRVLRAGASVLAGVGHAAPPGHPRISNDWPGDRQGGAWGVGFPVAINGRRVTALGGSRGDEWGHRARPEKHLARVAG